MQTKQPLRLKLIRKSPNFGKSIPDIPAIHDRRGKAVYNWDAIYSSGVKDPWSMAEECDKARTRAGAAKAAIERRDRARLARLDG